jgi:hypothetical protein
VGIFTGRVLQDVHALTLLRICILALVVRQSGTVDKYVLTYPRCGRLPNGRCRARSRIIGHVTTIRASRSPDIGSSLAEELRHGPLS